MLRDRVRERSSTMMRRAMEGMANLGERRLQPGVRRTCSSLRRAAGNSRPLVEQARTFIHSLAGDHRRASGDAGVADRLQQARSTDSRALALLCEVDRAAQANAEAIAALEEAADGNLDQRRPFERSLDLLRRQADELGAERERVLSARQHSREDVESIERELRKADRHRDTREVLVGLASAAGEKLTDWTDGVTESVKKKIWPARPAR